MQSLSRTPWRGYLFMDEIMQLHMVMPSANTSSRKHTKLRRHRCIPAIAHAAFSGGSLSASQNRPTFSIHVDVGNLRTSSLPIAYLLFKQKKDFKGATPIISSFMLSMPSCCVPQPLHWASFFELRVPDLQALTPCRACCGGLHGFHNSSLMTPTPSRTTKVSEEPLYLFLFFVF